MCGHILGQHPVTACWNTFWNGLLIQQNYTPVSGLNHPMEAGSTTHSVTTAYIFRCVAIMMQPKVTYFRKITREAEVWEYADCLHCTLSSSCQYSCLILLRLVIQVVDIKPVQIVIRLSIQVDWEIRKGSSGFHFGCHSNFWIIALGRPYRQGIYLATINSSYFCVISKK